MPEDLSKLLNEVLVVGQQAVPGVNELLQESLVQLKKVQVITNQKQLQKIKKSGGIWKLIFYYVFTNVNVICKGFELGPKSKLQSAKL